MVLRWKTVLSKIDRLAAFCDAVITIAITILVLGTEVRSVHTSPEIYGLTLTARPACPK